MALETLVIQAIAIAHPRRAKPAMPDQANQLSFFF